MSLIRGFIYIFFSLILGSACTKQEDPGETEKSTTTDGIYDLPKTGDDLIGTTDVEFMRFNIQDGVAAGGADTVAYFTQSKYVPGETTIRYEWKGATFLFSTEDNRDAFSEEPEKYAPQYGGYCAYAMSRGNMAGIDPQAFSIVDKKLYLNLSLSVRTSWGSNQEEYINKANDFWLDVMNQYN